MQTDILNTKFNNINSFFDDVDDKINEYVHIRCQQRNGRKTWTIIECLDSYLNDEQINKVLKDIKGEFCCGGTKIKDKNKKIILQLQGDHRDKISEFLTVNKIINKENIKIHGF